MESRVMLSAASLVKDINTATLSSNPFGAVEFGTAVYYGADDGRPSTAGYTDQLWRTDPASGATGLVKDFAPESGPDAYGTFVATPSHFYFHTSVNGTYASPEWLWSSDGTPDGTVRLLQVPGYRPRSSIPYDAPRLIPVGQTVYFSGPGDVLYKTDGTATGTARVAEVNTTAEQGGTAFAVGNTLYFVGVGFGSLAGQGVGLWKTNGTAAGTTLVKSFPAGTEWTDPLAMSAIGSTLYFTAPDAATGVELWKTNGTPAGTSLVKDIRPGADVSSTYGGPFRGPFDLTPVGNTLYFVATDGAEWTGVGLGWELYKTDGTADGTVMVKDISPGTSGSKPARLANVNGTLSFFALGEPWKSDGTAGGTVMVKDIFPNGPSWSGSQAAGFGDAYRPSAEGAVALGNLYVFTAQRDSQEGRILYRSDGTADGSFPLLDSATGLALRVYSDEFTVGRQAAYVTAFNDAVGGELFTTDGTPAGTGVVADVNTDTDDSIEPDPTYVPPPVTPLPDGIGLFVAKDWQSGVELWRTDGTEAGTRLVKDIDPGPMPLYPSYQNFQTSDPRTGPFELTLLNGVAYFAAFDPAGGRELWRSDGTEAGTVRVKDINPGTGSSEPNYLTVVGNTLFFFANDGTHGRELWKSDGTAGGTAMVADLVSGDLTFYTSPRTCASNGLLYFSTRRLEDNHTTLWRSDGTAAGTKVLGTFSTVSAPVAFGGGAVFQGTPFGSTTSSLFRTDGTMAGTVSLGFDGMWPLAVGGAVVFARASSPSVTSTYELWATDGTAGNQQRLATVRAGYLFTVNGHSLAGSSVLSDGVLYFAGSDGGVATGQELWRTDGTPQGTYLVKDINPGPADSRIAALAVAEGRVYFRADDGVHGSELWSSDGTPAGTALVEDIQAGANGSAPVAIGEAGGTLYFAAPAPGKGVELWKLPLVAPPPPAVVDVFADNALWSPPVRQSLAAGGYGDASLGFRLAGGPAAPGQPLPWTNLDRVWVRFDKPVVVPADALHVTGVTVAQYALAANGFQYDPTTRTALWTLATRPGLDRLRLSLTGVTDTAGTPLADFSLPFNVVPGDADRNGRVDAFDTLGAKARQGSNATTNPANYAPFYDVDGNGTINAFDTLGVKAKQGTNLNQVALPAPLFGARAIEPARSSATDGLIASMEREREPA